MLWLHNPLKKVLRCVPLSVLARKSSVIFRLPGPRTTFGESSEIFGKYLEIFGKSSLVCLYKCLDL